MHVFKRAGTLNDVVVAGVAKNHCLAAYVPTT
jgi:hypothetical protein